MEARPDPRAAQRDASVIGGFGLSGLMPVANAMAVARLGHGEIFLL
jgi:hypothetical protein